MEGWRCGDRALRDARLDFADASIVAVAEMAGIDVASFDVAIDRVATARRMDP
jgi:hypothetical protein